MLIVTKSYNIDKVVSLRNDKSGMDEYIKSIIPDIYIHNNSIFNNQKYFINFDILNNPNYSMDIKLEVSKTLVEGLHVVGYLDSFSELTEISRFVNHNRLCKFYERNSNKI